MRWHVIMWTPNQCDWLVYKAELFCSTTSKAESCIIKSKELLFTCESSGWISNESMRILRTETLSRIKLSVFKLLKWRALKVGSLCLSLVIDFLSAISKVLSLPHSVPNICLSFIPSLFVYLSPSVCAHHLTQPSSGPVLINQVCRQHEEQGYVNVLCQEPAVTRSCLLACLLVFLQYLLASLPGCLLPLQSACRWPCTSRV